jgi:cytoskeletal protein RodZ
MSDTSQGPGWWQASDQKWYPPEQHPNYQAPAPAAPPPPGPGPAPEQAAPYGRPLSTKEQARLEKANRKALRPWYKKKRWWALFVILLIVILIIVIIASAAKTVTDAAKKSHTIVYSVTGTGQASDITYDTLQEGQGQNGEAQETNVTLPWTKTITASGLFTAFDVSATVGSNGGSVTCTITEDGKQIATNTANGAFATADCTSAGT